MLLEAAGEYVFPCLFQFLEAAHTLWLVALSSIFKTSVASLSLSLSLNLSLLCFSHHVVFSNSDPHASSYKAPGDFVGPTSARTIHSVCMCL